MSEPITRAIVRRPPESFAKGITTAGLGMPDAGRAREQHEAYVEALRSCGLAVDVLPPLEAYPDSCFVEDTAVFLDASVVLARPGAPSRRGEERATRETLARHRPVEAIEAPGTLDGGDVLRAGDRWFVGISTRTNEAGAAALGRAIEREGGIWKPVPLAGGLHLKSDVNRIGGGRLLVTPSFAGREEFRGVERITVPGDEKYAANSLEVNGRLLVPAGFPRTRALLEGTGMDVIVVDVSEFQKMDGGLTCLSLRF
ncbi:MAG: arginine deiminase-related protein [Candidatus Eisenbacteria bacterium]